MNESYFEKTTAKRKFPKLEKDIKTQIAIIGGGLTGITLAYLLKDAFYDVVVIEANEIGCQTSAHSSAKITYLHGLIYYNINKYYGYDKAKMYYESNKEALEMIENIINKENIDCDLKKNRSIIYTQIKENAERMAKQKEILELFGEKVEENVYNSLYSIALDNQAIFHPLKYIYGLIDAMKDVQIYEHTKILKIHRGEEFVLETDRFKIHCDYVIHATRYPFIYKGLYFMKITQQQEYVHYGEEYSEKDSILCIDSPISFRPAGTGIIEISQDKQGDYNWFAQDSISLRIIPYIDELTHDEYIAYGYGKWGMTLSMVAAKIISSKIIGIDNKYTDLYGSSYYSYSLLKEKLPILLKKIKKGYIDNRICKKDDLKNGEGQIVRIKNRLMAVYKDEDGNYHYFSPYCPHLKCIIEFNKKTKCWNCPCHGSIYDAYGHVIIGPSLYDLKDTKN